MASRAFFRCRACGEPVVSGAYRCPVCGIDFPTGTPGAPFAPDSPATVDPARRDARGPAQPSRPSPAAPAESEVDTAEIATRLDAALGQELVVRGAGPVPDPRHDLRREPDELSAEVVAEWSEADAQDAPGTPGEAQDATEPQPGLAAASPSPSPADEAEASAAEVRRGPSIGGLEAMSPAQERRVGSASAGAEAIVPHGEPRPSAAASDTIVPTDRRELEGTGPARADLSVAPMRGREPSASAPAMPYYDVPPPTRQKRSLGRSLLATTSAALLVIVALGGAAWYADRDEGAGRLLTNNGAGADDVITVQADDGWVDIPTEPGAVYVTADGTFRLRVDGTVYTGTRNSRVRVPMGEGTALAVRTVRAPTVVQVSRELR
ncbi:hypothetical protein [Acuticoccus sp.]|uniref:hypothetical protein n=1 Tax=Acuticoccus sp. TaxID=1904378 RepID=UPI003B52170B